MVGYKELDMMIARCALRARLKCDSLEGEIALDHFQQLLERELDSYLSPPPGCTHGVR